MPFKDIFECDKEDLNLGFTSWDAFFTRCFWPGIRPVDNPDDPNVIVSACESTPLQLVKDITFNDKFWLKDQPYSVQDMLDSHLLSNLFIGGKVYHAFWALLVTTNGIAQWMGSLRISTQWMDPTIWKIVRKPMTVQPSPWCSTAISDFCSFHGHKTARASYFLRG